MIVNDLKKEDKDASLFIKRSDKQVEAVIVYANDKTRANEKNFEDYKINGKRLP